MKQRKFNIKIIVVGDPYRQKNLSARIVDELENYFISVSRIDDFSKEKINSLKMNVLVFLPRLPKIIGGIKRLHPELLLIPFKLANQKTSQIEIVKWMLEIHSALAVYSKVGDSKNYFIIDALGNETAVSKTDLPRVLTLNIVHFIKAIRRRSIKMGDKMPNVKYVSELVKFSRKMQPAFERIAVKNVISTRWPGNFSFRCTHGFLSVRTKEGFVITRRNVDKTGLTKGDFVFVSSKLKDKTLQFWGKNGLKPSIDAAVHRIIYQGLPWVNSIIHGHLHVKGECVSDKMLPCWPCGAENEGLDIVKIAPKKNPSGLWIINVKGHGFIALIKDKNPKKALSKLSQLSFNRWRSHQGPERKLGSFLRLFLFFFYSSFSIPRVAKNRIMW